MTSLLFLLALIPVLFVMLAVTLEFSHLVGVRDDLQNVVDEEGYDGLTYRRSSAEVEANLRARLDDRSEFSFSQVSVQSVASTVSPASASVSASLNYKGTFLSFLENFVGRQS
jgi:Flp pilus assembly protein TadG